jgi:dTDP-4-amino-4,6-dideoxygalactose transaminase
MKIPFLDLKAQYKSIKNEIDEAIKLVVEESSFIGGQNLSVFEHNYAKYCGAKYCIGVGNGTDAITIGLKALGLRSGDEVITAANSFIATSEAITSAGGRVVFADCHPVYYTIDVNDIERKITSKTKCIIPVHLYGQPADMPAIMKLARKYKLTVLEDSAQAHGAYIDGKRVGTFGDLSTFSFYPGKNLGAYGDGGAIVTNSKTIEKKCRMIANHGRIEKYNHEFEGVNSRLDALQCAILNTKLKYLDDWSEKRREVASTYNELLENISDLEIPEELENTIPVYHLYVVRTQRRDKLKEYLKENGIASGIHYPIALHNLKAYAYLDHMPKDFPYANQYQDQILSLPIYPELTFTSIKYIAETIETFFRIQ